MGSNATEMGRQRNVRFPPDSDHPNKPPGVITVTLIPHFVAATRGAVLPSATAIADISGFMK
jgi:hypothetical protein